jgi:hypothetical protein
MADYFKTIDVGITLEPRRYRSKLLETGLTLDALAKRSIATFGAELSVGCDTSNLVYSADIVYANSSFYRLANASAGPIMFGDTNKYTCELWYKQTWTNYAPDWHFIAFFNTTTYEDGYMAAFQYDETGSGRFLTQFFGPGGATSQVNSQDFVYTSALYSGQWVHIAFTVDAVAQTVQLYLDGVPVTMAYGYMGASAILSSTDAYAFITGGWFPGTEANGQIAEFRLWNDVRTNQEIIDNKDHALVGNEAGLAAYWKFDGNGLDSGPNGLDLEAVNNPGYQNNSYPFVIPQGNPLAKIVYKLSEATVNIVNKCIKPFTEIINTVLSLNTSFSAIKVFLFESMISFSANKTKSIYKGLASLLSLVDSGMNRAIEGVADAMISMLPRIRQTAQILQPFPPSYGNYSSYRIANASAGPIKFDNTNKYTCELWYKQTWYVYPDNIPADWHFLAFFNTTTYEDGYMAAFQYDGSGSGKFLTQFFGPGGETSTIQSQDPIYTSALYSGQWVHIAFTVDAVAQTVQLYIDGVPVTMFYGYMGASAILPSTDAYAYITGGWANGTEANGQIAEFRLWNDIRTNQEIIDNKDQELVGNEPGLAAYWKFNGDGKDSGPNGMHLESVGSPEYQSNSFPFEVIPTNDPLIKSVSKFLSSLISVTQSIFKRSIAGIAEVTLGLSAEASTMFGRVFNAAIHLTAHFSETVSTSVLWLRASMDWIWNQGRSAVATLSADIIILIKKKQEVTIVLDSSTGKRHDGIADVVITLTTNSIRLSRRLLSATLSLSARIIKHINKYLNAVITLLADISKRQYSLFGSSLSLSARAIPGLVRYIALTLSALFSYVKNYIGEVPVHDDPDTEPDNDIPTDNSGGGDGDQTEYVMCHVPGGLWSARHTIIVRGKQSLNSHIAQHPGDHVGPCSNGN